MTVRSFKLIGFAICVLASLSFTVKASSVDTKVIDGTNFGAKTSLRGIYFTNFENSAFVECTDDKSCSDWASKDQSWAHCEPDVCTDLNNRIVKLNGSHNNWGTFAITFDGRRGLTKRAKHFLNDREEDVLIEKIVDFRLMKGSANSN